MTRVTSAASSTSSVRSASSPQASEDVELETTADDSGDPEDGLDVFRKSPDASSNDVADSDRHVDGAARGVPSAFALHQPDQLGDEERVPTGPLVHVSGDGGDRVLGNARREAQQVGDVVLRQSGQAHPLGVWLPADIRQGVAERGLLRLLGVAERHDDQNRCVAQLDGEEPQEAQRRGVGPVDVIEDEDGGPFGSGPFDGLAHDVVETESSGIGGKVVVNRRPELREQRGENGTQVRGLEVIDAECPEYLHPRPERRSALVVVATAPARRDARLARNVCQLGGEAALADAGLALDKHHACASCHRLSHRHPQAVQGCGAPDEDRPPRRGVRWWRGCGRHGCPRREVGSGVQRRVLLQHLTVQQLQPASGLEAELLGEQATSFFVRAERLGLAACTVEHPHLQRTQALAQWRGGDEWPERRQGTWSVTDEEPRLDPVLLGRQRVARADGRSRVWQTAGR